MTPGGLRQYCPCPLQLEGSQIVGLAGGSSLLERGKQVSRPGPAASMRVQTDVDYHVWRLPHIRFALRVGWAVDADIGYRIQYQ